MLPDVAATVQLRAMRAVVAVVAAAHEAGLLPHDQVRPILIGAGIKIGALAAVGPAISALVDDLGACAHFASVQYWVLCGVLLLVMVFSGG